MHVHVFQSPTGSQNAEISLVTLLKCDCITDVLQAILKIIRKITRNICGGISFQYSYRWVDWTAQIA